ncbi:MAG TPA: transglycosylase family protein [Thermoleophilaceae bacterium]|jgi:hypothetical protein
MTMSSGAALAAEGGTSGGSTEQAQQASLSIGSTGKAVKAVQRKLGVSATGYYGTETARAVKRFQRRHGLRADGVVGPATAKALGVQVSGASYATGGSAPSSPAARTVRLPAVLRRIARCESGGNPRAISRDGRYRGKFQFDLATWRSLGGRGDPAQAPEWEQDLRALRLYRKRGTAPWANCA